MKKDKVKPTEKQVTAAEQNYPGTAADYEYDSNDKVNAKKVEQDVKSLNNNPRNNELDQ